MKDLTSYARPDRNPATAQTESGRVAQYHNNRNRVPSYSNVAGERERREKSK